MEEYRGIRSDLIDFLKTASGEDYDAVYYYIGQYDFNQSDPLSIEVVADLILEKATAQKKNHYSNKRSTDLIGVLYGDAESAPTILMPNISKRSQAEQSARAKGMTYIPHSTKFIHLVSSAASMPTQAEFEEIERNIRKSQTFRGQFANNLKKQMENPRENIGVGWLIVFAIVIFCVIINIIY